MKIHLRLLGALEIKTEYQTISSFRSHRAVAMLAYLVCQEQAAPRNELAHLIWPDKPEQRARANLRWALNYLGKLLPDCWEVSRRTARFDPGSDVFVDVLVLKRALEADDISALETAVAGVQGELLWGFYFDESSEFESWLLIEREKWRTYLSTALERLANHYEGLGEYDDALTFARRLLELEPWRESGHRRVMGLLARQERFAAALAQYEQCRRLLAEELQTTPTQPTESLRQRILALQHNPPPSLPAQPTPLVGRQAELDDLTQLLADPQIRLVTVLGLGGVGKTRLALEAATRQRHRFLDGVYYIPVGPVTETEQLVAALANGLQIGLEGVANPVDKVVNHLRQRELLLLLDSFEHLLGEAEQRASAIIFLSQLLSETPAVRFLITSRQRLNLRWEQLFDLDGLSFPETHGETAVEQFEAGQLFLQTARRSRRHFAPDRVEREAIAQLCRLVEGLPLALELAGAAVRRQSATELLAMVRQNLDSLASSVHDLPAHQRSLPAVFAHSWSLLPVKEQQTLAALSIFQGSFTSQAAQEILGSGSLPLASLVEKSLLRQIAPGRYELHRLVRQFAASKLTQDPARELAVQRAYAAHYLGLLARQEQQFLGDKVAQAITAVGKELPNVRAAWRWAVAKADLPLLHKGATGLARYYYIAGPLAEGVRAFARATSNWPDQPLNDQQRIVLGELMAHHSRLLLLHGNYETAVNVAHSLLQLAQIAGNSTLEAEAYLRWGEALCRQGRAAEAGPMLQKAVTLVRNEEPQPILFGIFLNLGVVAGDQGNVFLAQTYFEQAVAVSQALGDLRGQSSALHNLAWATLYQNDYASARAYFEQELQLCRRVNERRLMAAALLSLGTLHLHEGNLDIAAQYHGEAYEAAQEMGQQREQGSALNGLGLAALHRGLLDEAQTFFERARQINERIAFRQGIALSFLHQGMVRRQRGEFAQARTALQEAIELVRQLGDRRTTAAGLCQLSLTCYQLGEWESAELYGREAYALAQQLGDYGLQGKALTAHAHALAALGQSGAAITAYEQARAHHRQAGQPHLAAEALAGLVHIALEKGPVTLAEQHANELLSHLAERSTAGMEVPDRVRQTHWRLLTLTNQKSNRTQKND